MNIPTSLKKFRTSFDTWVVRFVPHRVTANMLTWVGGICNGVLVIAWLTHSISFELFLWLFLITQLFDILDGSVARVRNQQSLYGARLDAGIDIGSAVLLIIALWYKTVYIEFFWATVVICLLCVRYIFVWLRKDLEIGGYKNALVVGILFATYGHIDLNIVLQLLAVFHVLVISKNIANAAERF